MTTSTLVGPVGDEPLTLAQAIVRAGFDWVPGDVREPMLLGFIAAARAKVELDTELALPLQTRDLATADLWPGIFDLGPQCAPLQSVTWIRTLDGDAEPVDVDATIEAIDLRRAAIYAGGRWPYRGGRYEQPWQLRIVAGWPTPAEIPPLLLQAVGLLTAHYATVGRDLAQVGTIVAETPQGYAECIAPYVRSELLI